MSGQVTAHCWCLGGRVSQSTEVKSELTSWSPISTGGTLHCQSGHTLRGVFQQTTRYLIKVKWSFMLFLFWSCWCMPALSCREYCNHWYSTQKIIFRYPWHASCEVNWTIPTSCEEFKTKIINQMNAWEVTLGWPVGRTKKIFGDLRDEHFSYYSFVQNNISIYPKLELL